MTFDLTVFAPPSADGTDLARRIEDLAAELGARCRISMSPTQTDVYRETIRSDLVVLDATIERGQPHLYAAFTAQPMAIDHVLVVARSYLPQNFYGLVEGGAPTYPARSDNDAILRWLRPEVERLLARGPRSRWRKTSLGSVVDMFASLGADERRAGIDRAFISYRSADLDEALAVQHQLRTGAISLPGLPDVREAVVVRPGELAFEFEILSPLQRWSALSALEERLRTCRAVIAVTRASFLDSWWTRGELILAARRGRSSGGLPVWRVDLDADEPVLEAAPDAWRPAVTDEQGRTLDRRLSAGGRSAGAETSQRANELAKLPPFSRTPIFNDPVFGTDWAYRRQLVVGPATSATIEVERFLDLSDLPLVEVPQERLDEAAATGAAVVGDVTIRLAPDPRYRWYATRMGRPTGASKTGEMTIAELPVYVADPPDE